MNKGRIYRGGLGRNMISSCDLTSSVTPTAGISIYIGTVYNSRNNIDEGSLLISMRSPKGSIGTISKEVHVDFACLAHQIFGKYNFS